MIDLDDAALDAEVCKAVADCWSGPGGGDNDRAIARHFLAIRLAPEDEFVASAIDGLRAGYGTGRLGLECQAIAADLLAREHAARREAERERDALMAKHVPFPPLDDAL